MEPRVIQLGAGLTAVITPTVPADVRVPLADLAALQRTVAELLALLNAARPGDGMGDDVAVRSMQVLARGVQRRVAGLVAQ